MMGCRVVRPVASLPADIEPERTFTSPYRPSTVLPPSQQQGYIAQSALIKHYKGDPGVQLLSGKMGMSPHWFIPPNPKASPDGGAGSMYWAGSKPFKGYSGVQRVGGSGRVAGAHSQYQSAQATKPVPASQTQAMYGQLLSMWSR